MPEYGPPATDPQTVREYQDMARAIFPPGAYLDSLLRAIEMGAAQPIYDGGRVVGFSAAKNPAGMKPYQDPSTGEMVTPEAPKELTGGGAGGNITTADEQSSSRSSTNSSRNEQAQEGLQRSEASSTAGWAQSRQLGQEMRGGGREDVVRSTEMSFSGADAEQAWIREQLRQLALEQMAGAAAGAIGPFAREDIARNAGLSADAITAQYATEAEGLRRAAADAGIGDAEAAYHDAARQAASRRLDAIMNAMRKTEAQAAEANWAAREGAMRSLGGMQFAAGRGGLQEQAGQFSEGAMREQAGAQQEQRTGTASATASGWRSASDLASSASDTTGSRSSRITTPQGVAAVPPWLVHAVGGFGDGSIQGATPGFTLGQASGGSNPGGWGDANLGNVWGSQQAARADEDRQRELDRLRKAQGQSGSGAPKHVPQVAR